MQRLDKSFIILLPLLIYLLPFLMLLFSVDFYHSLFVKTNVDVPRAESLTKELFSYFKNNDYSVPEIKMLNENENSHIRDVKILLTASVVFFIFLLVIATIKLSRAEQKHKLLLYSSILSIILPLLFIIVDFSSFFTLFHFIFFPQGNWSFPVGSTLVSVYILEFFEFFAMNIFIRGEIISVIILVFSVFAKLYSEQQ